MRRELVGIRVVYDVHGRGHRAGLLPILLTRLLNGLYVSLLNRLLNRLRCGLLSGLAETGSAFFAKKGVVGARCAA